MTGERTAVRYRLGDRLTIKVVRVDLETAKIDFTLINKNKSLEEGDESGSRSKSAAPRLGEKPSARPAWEKSSPAKFGAGKSTPKFEGKFGHKPPKKSDAKPGGKPAGKSTGKPKPGKSKKR